MAASRHARLLAFALALVLVSLQHCVVCQSNHTHFSMISRHRGDPNAPSRRPIRGSEPAPAPSPDSCYCDPTSEDECYCEPTSQDDCWCAPTPSPSPSPSPKDFLNSKIAVLYPVIQAFKQTITSDPLGITKTWVGPEICSSRFGGDMYKGFYCESPPKSSGDKNSTLTVASIDFNGYGLGAPSLAGFIDAFPDLALFHANSNNFSGVIPNLTGLPFFYELDLSNNKFSGDFPANVVPLGGLLFLDLRFNKFAGVVPSPVFDISLVALFLNNNGFSGEIPNNFGSTTAEYLVVANNQFTGPIPKSIYNTSANLSEVLFLNNRLSGCLPYEIGLVEGLTVFDAGGNEITGPIPLSFGCLASVEELNLAGNQLYGHIPDVLCLLAKNGKLQNLSLSDNYFHSVGRHCLELVRSRVLDVRLNCILDFPHQRPVLECARFYADPPQHCPFVPHIPCDLPGFRPPLAAAAALPAKGGGGGVLPAKRGGGN
uniref:Leucine-rich repeat-containing N-terminal plant-type domain-containing protein n=1 Tax=Leersia perrieri TaxID=77586 RepID=A0A0D9WAY5_9ORYZ